MEFDRTRVALEVPPLSLSAQRQYLDGMNSYVYERSSPVNHVDPTGQGALWTAWGIAGFPQLTAPQAGGYLIGQPIAHAAGLGPESQTGVADEWMKRFGPAWYSGTADGVAEWLACDVAPEFWDEILAVGVRVTMGPGYEVGARIATVSLMRKAKSWFNTSIALSIAAPVLMGAGMYAGILGSVMYSPEDDLGY